MAAQPTENATLAQRKPDEACGAPAGRAYHTVLFDCDGTLLNTIEDIAAAGNVVCARHGWPTFSVDEFKLKVGDGQVTLVRRLMPESLADDEAALRGAYEEYCVYYNEHKQDATAPYPGILDLLDELRTAGVRLGVLTNKDDDAAQGLIRGYFGERLRWVQGRTDAMPPKPAPDMARALLRRMGIDPDDASQTAGVLMVGDSGVDVRTGVSAGLDACGVLWGFRGREELAQAGARHIAARPAEVAQIVLGRRA